MASATFNPHSSDCAIRATDAVSFASVRGAATGTVISAADASIGAYSDNTAGAYYNDRPIMCFDTSSLPDAASITSATLALATSSFHSPVSGAGAVYVDLVAASPASPTSIASGDYSSFGTTQLATRLDVSGGGTQTFTLNSAGRAAINVTGYTSLFVITGNDFGNSAASPTNLAVFDYYTQWAFNSSSGATPPVLTVNYTVAGGSPPSRRRPSGLYIR